MPKVGRYLEADPIGLAGGDVNLYSYVRNSPTNLVDPSGEIAVAVAAPLIIGGIRAGAAVLPRLIGPIFFLPPKAQECEETWHCEEVGTSEILTPGGILKICHYYCESSHGKSVMTTRGVAQNASCPAISSP
jgi:uncharacterized protein RhaS with RHS repeats